MPTRPVIAAERLQTSQRGRLRSRFTNLPPRRSRETLRCQLLLRTGGGLKRKSNLVAARATKQNCRPESVGPAYSAEQDPRPDLPGGMVESTWSLPWSSAITEEPPVLEMRSECERCGQALTPDGPAAICSYECTFCHSCREDLDDRCPNCSGLLVARPPRAAAIA